MATTMMMLSQLEKPRRSSDFDAAYLTLCFSCDGFFSADDLLCRRRRCAEVAYGVDATKLHKFRLAPTEVVQLFDEMKFVGNWPLFTYDSSSQTLIIRNTRGAGHDEVHISWMKVFSVLSNIGLRHHGVARRIRPFQTQEATMTTLPERILSGKCIVTADWTLYLDKETRGFWRKDAVMTPRLVISIAFQDRGHAELARDAERWLETAESVARVVLVTVIEDAPYSCPIPFDELENAELPPFSDFMDLLYPDGPHHVMAPLSGPIQFAGRCWTGKMTHVWSETWSRHKSPSGLRSMLDEESRQDLLAEDDDRPCELVLQQIAGSELPLTRDLAGHKMVFDKRAFRKAFLSYAARDLALQRYDRLLAVQAILCGASYASQVYNGH